MTKNTQLDIIIDYNKEILSELQSIKGKIEKNEQEIFILKQDVAITKTSIKYQWWIITFVGFLIFLLFANV